MRAAGFRHFWRLRGKLAILVLAALQAACAGLPGPLQSDAFTDLPPTFRLSNLPYFPQQDDQCGPASLATMLGARGVEVTPEQLRPAVYIPAKRGSLATEMVARARRHGMVVYPLQPELGDVLAEVSSGNPVLVLQNLSFGWLPRWHFSVVIGYDLERQTVTLRSGAQRAYEVDMRLFGKTWQRAEGWAVVVMQPDQIPRTAGEARFLQAAHELELVGELPAALAAYRAALRRWPASTLAWFGAGNVAFALQQYLQASEFFSGHIQHSPFSAAGWNNLAYSLLEQQCAAEATAAIACALQLAPDDRRYLDSYVEIAARRDDRVGTSRCTVPACPRPGAAIE